MGGNGPNGNGLMGMAPTGGGGSFLSGIPWWAYVIVILIGLGISVFCFIQYQAARRRAMVAPMPGSPPPLPGAPPPLAGAPVPGAGNGYLIAAIGSGLLLVLAPLVVMLIMQPWHADNWIVGRWSERPGCMGDTVEFTSGGTLIAEGRSRVYRIEGDQITVDGQTQTVQHDGDRLMVRNETMYRCSGSIAAADTATPAPLTPAPGAYPPSAQASPGLSGTGGTSGLGSAFWLAGRWSDSDCSRSMEFRSDGTATTANGEPATFQVVPNGAGWDITIDGGGRHLVGYLERQGYTAVRLRVDQPSPSQILLRRC